MTTFIIAAIVIAQAAGSPPSTGYPACDRFIQMVTECINTKVPPAARADKKQELDAFRSALSFIPGSVAAEKCAENIKREMQRDRYGCYGAQAAKAGLQTPCSLVTRAELQQILSTEYSEGQPGASKCSYATADGSPRSVTIEVRWTGGTEELANARALKPSTVRPGSPSKLPAVDGRTINGVGDDAYLIQAGLMPMLYVRRGDTAVVVMAPAKEEQLTAIARKALERLTR
jgi:hypothetical protein